MIHKTLTLRRTTHAALFACAFPASLLTAQTQVAPTPVPTPHVLPAPSSSRPSLNDRIQALKTPTAKKKGAKKGKGTAPTATPSE